MSTAHHPQTDGVTERQHRTLEQMLRAYVNSSQDDWHEQLQAAAYAINTSLSVSTGYTPYELVYGAQPTSSVV